MIFSIAMGADYSFEVKNIEIWVPAFFKHNNSYVATVLIYGLDIIMKDVQKYRRAKEIV